MANLTTAQAKELCDSIGLDSEFFDEDKKEYIFIKERNPGLLSAYEALFTIAYAD